MIGEREALEISRRVAEEVRREVLKIAGKRVSDEVVGMGKDGTPTKRIDKVAEDVAISILKEYDLRIVSEEAGVVGEGEVCVALDPVDGTFNATRGIPMYSISMCFSKGDLGSAFFGYVMNLATGDEYYSIGGKSFKNDEVIRVSNKEEISESDAIFYYPSGKHGFKRLRIYGSASLEVCLVAEGAVDCFIDVRRVGRRGFLRIYDVAAGVFIAKNAGARVTDDKGREIWGKRFDMSERLTLVVANPRLHEKIIKMIGGVDVEGMHSTQTGLG